jgi:single-stranded-DNA-specific exonuclease
MVLNGDRYDWSIEPEDPALVSRIAAATGASRTFAGVMVARGLSTAELASRYLSPGDDPLADPRLLPDADRVLGRVSRAVDNGELIAVHGHDDADGVTATAIMVEALCQLGARTRAYIPDRRTEGHGLNRAELTLLSEEGVRLVITVDSCVSDREFIAYGNGLGIDTIVTDHHEIPPELPPAAAIVNPKLPDSAFPYRFMAGVGVSLRVADLLLDGLGHIHSPRSGSAPWSGPRWREESLALAAIGSIADKVPLTEDNRSIVAQGLAALPLTERPGLRAALEEGRLWGRAAEAEDVRDSLGPLLGRAPGPFRGTQLGLDLLLTEDEGEARSLAGRLYERQGRWRNSATAAWEKVRSAYQDSTATDGHSLVILEAEVPVAAVGYVTSRLAEESGRPAIILTRRGADVVAEARGPAGFNFVDGFATMRELFRGYGGHPRAAGFSMDPVNVPEFRRRMFAFVDANPPAPNPRALDGELHLDDATAELARELEQMEPFGQGNHRACFLSRAVDSETLADAESVGVRFATVVSRFRGPTDIIIRLRESNGVPLVAVVDTVVSGGSGG